MVDDLMGFSPYWLNRASTGSSRATQGGYQNGSGSTLAMAVPVYVDPTGQIFPLDVSNEVSVQALVGLTGVSIPNAATGSVVDNGRLENITTSFTVGDAVYAGKSTPLTNVKPDIGNIDGFASGDFVIFIGVVVKNEFNPLLFDLKLMLSVVGQL
jgi:hypothetical protein